MRSSQHSNRFWSFWERSPHPNPTSIFSTYRNRYLAQISSEIRELDVVGSAGSSLKDCFVELLDAESKVECLIIGVINFEQKDAHELFNCQALMRLDILGHFEDGITVKVVEKEV